MVDKPGKNGHQFIQRLGREVELCFAIAEYSNVHLAAFALARLNNHVDYNVSPSALKVCCLFNAYSFLWSYLVVFDLLRFKRLNKHTTPVQAPMGEVRKQGAQSIPPFLGPWRRWCREAACAPNATPLARARPVRLLPTPCLEVPPVCLTESLTVNTFVCCLAL